MHRKTSTAAERLIALRTLIVVVASRAVVASAQVAVIVLASVRRREGMAGFAYATVLTFAIVAGTAVGVRGDSPAPSTVAIAGAQDRLAAAERADRSSRTDVAPPSDAAEPAQMLAPAPAWVSPMPGAEVSSCYGPRWGAMHMGMDFAGPNGTQILASGGGTIFGVGWLYSGYGMSVVIDHGNGFFTHYAHASRINVAVGQQVSTGQTIAWEGSTGNSTGPHLHFEVHQGLWNQVNPAQFLRDRGAPIGC